MIEGIIKQQCTDDQGLYVWQKKHFKLNQSDRSLTITSLEYKEEVDSSQYNNDPVSTQTYYVKVPLNTVKYAKAWSYSSPLAGYGFDILWTSGKVWSFLVETEEACNQWVSGINSVSSLKQNEEEFQRDQYQNQTNTSLDVTQVPNLNSSANNLSQNNSTFSLHHSNNNISSPTSSKSNQTKDLFKNHMDFLSNFPQPISQSSNKILKSDSSSVSTTTSRYSNAPIDSNTEDYFPQSGITVPPIKQSNEVIVGLKNNIEPISEKKIQKDENLTNSQSEFLNQMKSIFEATKKSLQKNENTIRDSFSKESSKQVKENYPNLINSTKSQNIQEKSIDVKEVQWNLIFNNMQQLLKLKDKEIAELIESKNQMEENYDNIILDLKASLKKALKKSTQTTSMPLTIENIPGDLLLEIKLNHEAEIKKNYEDKIKKIIDDNNSSQDLVIEHLKLKHKKEYDIISNELEELRKKYEDELEKNHSNRKTIEKNQIQFESELSAKESEIKKLKNDYHELQINSIDQLNKKENDKKKRISELENEFERKNSELQEEIKNINIKNKEKIDKIVKKYEDEIKMLSNSQILSNGTSYEELREEFMKEKNELLLSQQEKHQKEILNIKNMNKKNLEMELLKLHQYYQERENQTSNDLMELEKLHNTRITYLENSLKNEKKRNKNESEKESEKIISLNNKIKELNNELIIQKKNYNHLLLEKERIELELREERNNNSKNSAKVIKYETDIVNLNEKLKVLLMESKIFQTEKITLQEEISKNYFEINEWKKNFQQQKELLVANEKSLRISKEEILMLENEIKRLKNEKNQLKNSLDKAEKLIYGVPQTSSASNQVLGNNRSNLNVSSMNNSSFIHANNSSILSKKK